MKWRDRQKDPAYLRRVQRELGRLDVYEAVLRALVKSKRQTWTKRQVAQLVERAASAKDGELVAERIRALPLKRGTELGK